MSRLLPVLFHYRLTCKAFTSSQIVAVEKVVVGTEVVEVVGEIGVGDTAACLRDFLVVVRT